MSHSPPTLISYNSLCRKYQYKLLYYFHITVEQGTVNFVQAWRCQSSNCTLTAIQLGDAILTLGMHKCTQYSFILLSRWAMHQMWRPLWTTCKNTLHFDAMFVFSVSHPRALHSDNFLDEKQEIITPCILMQVLYLVGIVVMIFDLLTCGHSQGNCPPLYSSHWSKDVSYYYSVTPEEVGS